MDVGGENDGCAQGLVAMTRSRSKMAEQQREREDTMVSLPYFPAAETEEEVVNGETEEVGDKAVVDEEVKTNEERESMPFEAVTGDNQYKPEEEVNRGDPLDASPQQIRELQQSDEWCGIWLKEE